MDGQVFAHMAWMAAIAALEGLALAGKLPDQLINRLDAQIMELATGYGSQLGEELAGIMANDLVRLRRLSSGQTSDEPRP